MKMDAYLNDFATRCFRDVADRDYINARMCYRAGLVSQFHWAALQAFEKYYKAILLYNRVKAKNIKHNLSEARKLCVKLPFNIKLSDSSTKLMEHLDSFGRFRYLETSYYIIGPKLVELDRAVWELRRYCRSLNYSIQRDGKEPISMLDYELKVIENSEKRSAQLFKISGGALEAIIEKRSHPARPALIWKNGFYGKSHRKLVSVPVHFYSENSPLYLHPEILEHVLEYVYLPKDVFDAFRQANNPPS